MLLGGRSCSSSTYTQLSVLLTAMQKQHDTPRRIGFVPVEEREKKP